MNDTQKDTHHVMVEGCMPGVLPFLCALAVGGHGFEFCVFVVGRRHVLYSRSERLFITINGGVMIHGVMMVV